MAIKQTCVGLGGTRGSAILGGRYKYAITRARARLRYVSFKQILANYYKQSAPLAGDWHKLDDRQAWRACAARVWNWYRNKKEIVDDARRPLPSLAFTKLEFVGAGGENTIGRNSGNDKFPMLTRTVLKSFVFERSYTRHLKFLCSKQFFVMKSSSISGLSS